MLPDVHHDDGLEPGDVAVLVQRDPVVAQAAGRGVQVCHGPADAAHPADRGEVLLPRLRVTEGLSESASERRRPGDIGSAVRGHVPEVPLVQNHAVVLEPEPARELRVRGRTRLA